MKTHELKTDPEVFAPVWNGTKTYEIRFDDRGFAVGDILFLRETRATGEKMSIGAPLEYTGREKRQIISHILRGPLYGLQDGWVILSFEPERHHKLEMQYIGAVSLLGRLSSHLRDNGGEDSSLIKMVMEDLRKALPGRFEIWKTTSGGWSLEPIREKGGET